MLRLQLKQGKKPSHHSVGDAAVHTLQARTALAGIELLGQIGQQTPIKSQAVAIHQRFI